MRRDERTGTDVLCVLESQAGRRAERRQDLRKERRHKSMALTAQGGSAPRRPLSHVVCSSRRRAAAHFFSSSEELWYKLVPSRSVAVVADAWRRLLYPSYAIVLETREAARACLGSVECRMQRGLSRHPTSPPVFTHDA